MKLLHLRRNAGIAATVLALSVTLAACGDDGDDNGNDSGDSTSETSEDTSAKPSDDMSEDTGGSDAAAQTFGDGCAEVPADGAGSFDGMVQDPVATAASNNPLLQPWSPRSARSTVSATRSTAPRH